MFFALIFYPPIISAFLLWSIEEEKKEEVEKIEEGGGWFEGGVKVKDRREKRSFSRLSFIFL